MKRTDPLDFGHNVGPWLRARIEERLRARRIAFRFGLAALGLASAAAAFFLLDKEAVAAFVGLAAYGAAVVGGAVLCDD